MNTNTSRLLTVAALVGAVSVLAFTGCNKQDRADVSATTKEAVDDTKDAFKDAWSSVKSHTFEKRSDFTTNAKALTSRMDAEVSKMHANYSDAKASASRKAAMTELKDSEADYKAKVGALGDAKSATWDSAKQNVIASWDRLQASYYKARAD